MAALQHAAAGHREESSDGSLAPEAEVVFATEAKDGLQITTNVYLVKVSMPGTPCFELKLQDTNGKQALAELPVQSSICLSQGACSVFKCTLPYHEVMLELMDHILPGSESICTLGHGLGEAAISWQSRLAARGQSLKRLTAVDNCKQVLELAQSLLCELPSSCTSSHTTSDFIEADALEFMAPLGAKATPAAVFDIIIVDIGICGVMNDDTSLLAPPPGFLEVSWLEAATGRLKPGGALLINLLAASAECLPAVVATAKEATGRLPRTQAAVYTCKGTGHYPSDLNVLLALQKPPSKQGFPAKITCETALGAIVVGECA